MKTTLLALTILSCALSFSQNWTQGGTQLTTTDITNEDPRIGATSTGEFYMSWIEYGTIGIVKLNAFSDAGEQLSGWPAGGLEISNPNGDYWQTELIVTDDDMVVVTWFGYTTTGTGSDRMHVFAQKYDATGVAQWNSGNPIQLSNTTDKHNRNMVISDDGSNGAFVAWMEYDLSFSPSSSDIYIRRIYDSGSPYPAPTLVAGEVGVSENNPEIAINPNGSDVWMTYMTGSTVTDLRIIKLSPLTGLVHSGWVPGGYVTVSPGSNIYPNAGRKPKLFVDNGYNAHVMWVEFRGDGEIYLQKYSNTGTALYTANGQELYATAADDISYMSAIMNDNYSITYAWREFDNLVNDVLVNRVDVDGNVQLSTELDVSTANVVYPQIIQDGHNGNFLFYKDITISNTHELVAMRIDANVEIHPQWSDPGPSFGVINNLNGTNPFDDFQVVAHEQGGGIVVWDRILNSEHHILGCNVYENGIVCDTATVIDDSGLEAAEISFELYPNPAQNEISIEISSNEALYIRNVLGDVVKRELLKVGNNKIQISDLAKGVYLVQVGRTTQKLILD